MAGSTTEPNIFISYSWSTPQHEAWVLALADKLMSDGVNVLIDKWDLQPGHEKNSFMEKSVLDEKVTKVLIICDKAYTERANARKGGVGTETQLISEEVYKKVDQEKFIAIVKERDVDGEPYIPRYIASRIYFDFSNDSTFDIEYQKLVRNLYGKAEYPKPPLGEPPAYIASTIEDEGVSPARIKTRYQEGQSNLAEFENYFLQELDEMRFKPVKDKHYDEVMLAIIERMKPLISVWNTFTASFFSKPTSDDQLEQFHNLLEKIGQFQLMPADVHQWRETDANQYHFFSYEVMLNLIATLTDLKRYKEIDYLVSAIYFLRKGTGELKAYRVNIFNGFVAVLDQMHNQRLKLNRVSVTADLIKQRSSEGSIKFNALMEADLLLYYLTLLKYKSDAYSIWFPRTSVYRSFGNNLEVFERLISKQQFEKIKQLFGVRDPDELKKLITETLEEIKEKGTRNVDSFHYNIRPLNEAIKLDDLASL